MDFFLILMWELRMNIYVNGIKKTVKDDVLLKDVKEQLDPIADIVIYKGFPCESLDITLTENDEVFFIKRGRELSLDEVKQVMISRHSPGVVQILEKATVGIAGAGGLGSNIAVALSRIGIGKLIIADFDVVEPSNLNRQQFFMKQLGEPKVKALKDTLLKINPYQKLDCHNVKITADNIKDIFKDCTILIEAFDRAEEKTMLIKEGIALGKTIIAASGVAGYGDNDSIITKKVNDRFYVVGDFENEARPGLGLMAPRVMIAAAKQANLAVELLLKEK